MGVSTVLQELAREEEHRLRDRHHIGYVSGLKAGVLIARGGGSFDDALARARDDLARSRDSFDLGRLDGLAKARRLQEGG